MFLIHVLLVWQCISPFVVYVIWYKLCFVWKWKSTCYSSASCDGFSHFKCTQISLIQSAFFLQPYLQLLLDRRTSTSYKEEFLLQIRTCTVSRQKRRPFWCSVCAVKVLVCLCPFALRVRFRGRPPYPHMASHGLGTTLYFRSLWSTVCGMLRNAFLAAQVWI